jgi:hypothetical protein
MKASRARISLSGLKTGGGAVWMVHVPSLWRLHHDQAEDGWVDATGYVRPCYDYFTVFIVFPEAM